MGERKVQAKYYPPDFDPSRLPRIKRKRHAEDAVRFMLPMSVRCESCGEFMGTGLKFNAKKSDSGENYLGIRIFRFSMKCKSCPATFTIKTDPKNSDYTCESGVRRNYEPWKEEERLQKESKEERERQDQDVIQALENKTVDAKKELEDLDELSELKSANAQRASITVDDVLAKSREHQRSLEDEVEKQLRDQARTLFRSKKRSEAGLASGLTVPASSNIPNLEVKNDTAPKASVLGTHKITLRVKKKIKKSQTLSTKSRMGAVSSLTGLADYSSSGDSDSGSE